MTLPDALQRVRQRTAHHAQALYRARDEDRTASAAWSDEARTELPLASAPLPEWREDEGWRSPPLSSPRSLGLGLSLSSTALHELHSPLVSELSSDTEGRDTPEGSTSAPGSASLRPAVNIRTRLSPRVASPAPTLLRRRISSSLLAARFARTTPEPPSSATPSSSLSDEPGSRAMLQPKRSNTHIRRLFRSGADEEEGIRAPHIQAVKMPTAMEKSPRLWQDLPEMPNPYAAPATVAPSSFLSDSHQSGRQRQHLLNELADTEHTYAADLGVIKNLYLAHARQRAGLRALPSGGTGSGYLSIHTSPDMPTRSLSSLSLEHDELGRRGSASDPSVNTWTLLSPRGSAMPPPLSVNDIHVIFAGLEPCYSLAQEMSEQLSAAARAQRTVSSVFLEQMSAIEQAFSVYCARHEAAVARLADVTNKSGAAAQFLRECDELARPHTTAWDLSSLLIKPVQRVLKYPLFLRSILEQTSRTDPEFESLQQALTQIQGVADRINESKKRMDVVGQHGFEPLATPRAPFRRPVGGALRKAKGRSSEGPLTNDEGHYHALVARLEATEQQLVRFSQYCAAWTTSVRAMYHAELRVVIAWMALYEVGTIAEHRAALERLVQFRLLLEERFLGQVCPNLERSVEHAVHAKIRAALQLLERPKMVVRNRSAKEAEYRKHLAERARRADAPPSAGAIAFLSMHMQLVDEIPTLLRGLDVVLQHCMLVLSQVQAAFHGVMADQLEQFCMVYMPNAMTPTSSSSASSARFPDMHGSPAATSSSAGPGTVPSSHSPWAQSDSQASVWEASLPVTPSKSLPGAGLGAGAGPDISTMATTHGLLDEPLSVSTPHPPRSVYPDPNGPLDGTSLAQPILGLAQTPVRTGAAPPVAIGGATPRAALPVLDLSFDGYAHSPWTLDVPHEADVDNPMSNHSSSRQTVFFDARSSLGEGHALRRSSQHP